MLFLAVFVVFLYIHKESMNTSVEYVEFKGGELYNKNNEITESRPFASVNGKTYTFNWCSGASIISDKNKIYFDTEKEAQNSGRTLSKLCNK
jgi:hypothetical protein